MAKAQDTQNDDTMMELLQDLQKQLAENKQLMADQAEQIKKLQSNQNPSVTAKVESPTDEMVRKTEQVIARISDLRDNAEKDLLAGPQQFKICLWDNKRRAPAAGHGWRMVGAKDALEAQDKYLRFYGIITTGHTFKHWAAEDEKAAA